jgi:predicted house-cleaning noncanonical NTP pyrophosphatase (MazG superfamily)
MRKFRVEKLVRDKILDNIYKNKLAKADYKILNDREFLVELKKKFYEELEEFDPTDTENAKNELVDLQLLIDYFKKILDIKKEELKLISKKKNEKAGGFDKKIFLKTVELDEKDEWLPYYEKKFKEIK